MGSGSKAAEDLAAALSYISKNAAMFGVGTENYPLWGSSAGARMAGDTALHGVAGFGGVDIPEPCMVVIAYTGHTSYSETYPPAFIVVSADDPIVNLSVVDRRVANLRKAGIDVAYRKYQRTGHGFGLGVVTDAEGWIADAVRFWIKHRRPVLKKERR